MLMVQSNNSLLSLLEGSVQVIAIMLKQSAVIAEFHLSVHMTFLPILLGILLQVFSKSLLPMEQVEAFLFTVRYSLCTTHSCIKVWI